MKIFDDFKFSPSQRLAGDVYLKLIETFKFAFSQRTKIGDPFNSPYEGEIRNVSNAILLEKTHFEIFYKIIIYQNNHTFLPISR